MREAEGRHTVAKVGGYLLKERFCQFHIRMVWSSEEDMIQGNSWWKKTVRT